MPELTPDFGTEYVAVPLYSITPDLQPTVRLPIKITGWEGFVNHNG